VAWLAERFVCNGGEIHFGVSAVKLEQLADAVTVFAVDETSEPLQVRCQFVAGCDGARSALLGGIANASVFELRHPFRWFALIAAAPPSKPRTLYGFHPRGFAGQFRRSPTFTRFMLEVPGGSTLAEWPDERIWAELQQRLQAAGEPELAQGPFVERDVLDLRVRVIEPMHHHRLYLAGDSAHLITPAAGKGMNLAIQDAIELGVALRERYTSDRLGTRLAAYSTSRLPSIWRTQEFSNWMLTLFFASLDRSPITATDHEAPETRDFARDFAYRLRRSPTPGAHRQPGAEKLVCACVCWRGPLTPQQRRDAFAETNTGAASPTPQSRQSIGRRMVIARGSKQHARALNGSCL
jgi:p-hydroxybenzoate 3-monooxygenase